MKKNKGGINMAELTVEEKAIKNREAVKKCMKNKDRINVLTAGNTRQNKRIRIKNQRFRKGINSCRT